MSDELLKLFNEKMLELQNISREIRKIDRGLLKRTRLLDGESVGIHKEDFCVPSNVRVFSDRKGIMKNLSEESKGAIKVIAEIGVLYGAFSKFLQDTFRPAIMHLFDRDFSKITEPDLRGEIIFHEGNSSKLLMELDDSSLDMAYVDGDHTRKGVMADVESLLPKMKENSWLVFNDYSRFNVECMQPYGVMDAVHYVLNTTDYKLHSMCLTASALNDICLYRS